MTKSPGVQVTEFTYRTISLTPPAYERELAEALFGILGSSVHEPEAIAAALNEAGFRPSVAADSGARAPSGRRCGVLGLGDSVPDRARD